MPTPNSLAKNLFHALAPEARLLFIRLRSMGDCLLLTAPLRALKHQFPRLDLSVLVEERYRECFSGNPDISEVRTTQAGKYSSVKALIGKRFDAIINLHGGPTSLLYSCSARGVRIGIEGFQYPFLYSGLIPRGNSRMHAVEKTLEWFRWMGLDSDAAGTPKLTYARHPTEAEWVRDAIGRGRYVVIHPAAAMETKRWTVEGFAAVGKTLRSLGWRPVVTVGPGEEALAAMLSLHLPQSQILLGLSIPQLAELIRGAGLYLGNDSGPMHLAAAVGTPIVAAWGSSSSARWRPWGVPHRVVQNPFDCNPCAGYQCEVAATPLCIESIGIEQVTDAVQDLLQEVGRWTPIPTSTESSAD